jgi:hypothetical protein
LFGALLSLFGLYLRMGIPESETFVEIKEHGHIVRTPLGTSVRRYPKQLLQIAAIQFVGVPYYLWSTFIPTYAHLVSHISLSRALTGNTIGLVVYLFALPAVGRLADRYGRKPFLLAGAIGRPRRRTRRFVPNGTSTWVDAGSLPSCSKRTTSSTRSKCRDRLSSTSCTRLSSCRPRGR